MMYTKPINRYEHTLEKYSFSIRAFGLEPGENETFAEIPCAALQPYHVPYKYGL